MKGESWQRITHERLLPIPPSTNRVWLHYNAYLYAMGLIEGGLYAPGTLAVQRVCWMVRFAEAQ